VCDASQVGPGTTGERDPAPFKTYAVRLYGRDGVQAACLSLQDDHGVDVDLALFAAWTGAMLGRRLDGAAWALADAHVAEWRDDVIAPLRAIRRAMKLLDSPPAEAEELRARVKALELDAEFVELAMLEAIAGGLGAPAVAGAELAEANLRALAARAAPGAVEAFATIAAACHDPEVSDERASTTSGTTP
jgi:uncharacterized protein (TIGR02444 family)